MKRLGLTLITAVCLTATTFAAGNQPTTAKWDGNINVTKLSKYLNLSADQHEEVANICDYFSTQMERATTAKKDQKMLSEVDAQVKVLEYTAAQWKKLSSFAMQRRMVSPDENTALKYACQIPSKMPSGYQSQKLLALLDRAMSEGFKF